MKEDHAEDMIVDTVYQLQQILADISMMEVNESFITHELEEIKTNFGDEGNGFYGSMIFDSTGRAQKMLKYRARAQGMLDRINAFTRGGRHKSYIVEGGVAEYD